MRHPSTTFAAVVLLSAAALTGCASPTEDTAAAADPPLSTASEPAGAPATSTSAPATSATSDDTTTGADQGQFVPLSQDGEAPGSGASSVVGARTGQHEGYERVVLDLEGAAGEQAGWFATTVDQPVQDASGELLDVDGDRFVNLNVTGIANGGEGQVDSAGRRAFTGTVEGSGDLVEQVYVGGAWEGQAQVLVGLDDDVTEYRVQALSDPQRIVLDVR